MSDGAGRRVIGAYQALATLSPPRDRGALLVVLQAAIRAGAVPHDLGDWLKSMLDLPDLRLRNVMVPRVDVVAVAADASVADAARLMAEDGRRRLPVYQGTLDRPIGILHALDVAYALATKPPQEALPTAAHLARPTVSLADTLPLPDVIRAMHSQAAHMVLVVDEHGGFAGLATLEDIFEQIVGPIPDEYGDEGRDAIRIISEGVAVVGAAAGLHEIERLLNVRFGASRFVSIGGLVYDRLGRVPLPGDVVELPGMRIDVLSTDGARLRELRIRAGVGLSSSGAQPDALPEDTWRLDLRIDKEVVCGTEVVGRLEHLAVDPGSGRLSHIGVRRRRGRVVVVPLEDVEREDDGVVHLRSNACDALGSLPAGHAGTLPDHAACISRDTEVVCIDGPVGTLRDVLLDRLSSAATHLVVRLSRALLIPHEVVAPFSWARAITSIRIELAARSEELMELPEFRHDDEIRVEVLRCLDESPAFQGINRYTAHVDVAAGVVRLSGRVRTSELKHAVQEVAGGVRGVLFVDNQLIADDELAISVKNALSAQAARLEDIEVSVLLGVVTLRGKAATDQDRRAAEEAACAVRGVESVVNEVSV